jgi:sporulation protein YlmC with PRC-barrel domain
MKSVLLGGAMALALTVAASAQTAKDSNNSAKMSNPATTSAGAGEFITQQQQGVVRAPKLVGVAVYDKENKSIGKVSDLLLDKEGKVEAVVIGIGGFLGIGTKDIALPYDAVHWQTEQRTVATNGAAPATTGNTMNNTTGSATGTATANNAPAQKTVTPEQQEAYNGYPDRAVVDMSQQQLKDAPEFKYASQTANSAADVNGAAKNP